MATRRAPIHQTIGWNQKTASTAMWIAAVRLSRRRTWQRGDHRGELVCGEYESMPSGSRITGRPEANDARLEL